MVRSAILRGIIERFEAGSDADLADFIAEELRQINAIRFRLRALACQRQAAIDDHNAALRRIQERERLIRDECKHWETRRMPDPSGGGDSTTYCDVCGQEF